MERREEEYFVAIIKELRDVKTKIDTLDVENKQLYKEVKLLQANLIRLLSGFMKSP